MKGFTVIELIVVMILIFTVTGISALVYNQVIRNSQIVTEKINIYEQLAKIDSAIRRELLKAGPTSDGLTVQSNSVTFFSTVPFSKGVYGTYGSATKLKYTLSFSNGTLVLTVEEINGSYSQSTQIGALDACTFSSPRTGVIFYTLVKKAAGRSYELRCSVVLSNIK